MSEQIKARLRRDMDRVWNQGDLAAIDELYAADIVRHPAPPGSPAGIEGVRLTIGEFRAAVPDLQYTMEELTVDGDLAALRWSMTGTQEGEVLGTPATGEKMAMSGISMVRIVDGKIAELWTAMTPSF
jgi:steroid delta-isomerase-like uncharacterized protein